jgi:hypothetical protein
VNVFLQTHEGYPLVDSSQKPTKNVHVFGEKWMIQGEGYEAQCYKQGRCATMQLTAAHGVYAKESRTNDKALWNRAGDCLKV